MERNRIAIFLGGYLPAKRYGGPVTSVANLVENLGNEYNFFIISNDHDLDDKTRLPGIHEGWNQVGKAKVLYIKENGYKKSNFCKIMQEIQPNCIYLSSVFYYQMNYPAIKAAKKLNIPVILALRGELNPNALRIKYFKKRLYLIWLRLTGKLKNMFFQGTSIKEVQHIKKTLHVSDDKVYLLPNFASISAKKSEIKKQKKTIKIIFIARIIANKNLKYAISLASRAKSFVEMDIYGPVEDLAYWNECKSEMEKAPSNVHFYYKGSLSPDETKKIYLEYDVMLFPTEFENYGQVIAEALSHDCVPIISKGTTPWDDINEVELLAYKIGDDEGFISAIDKIAEMDAYSYEILLKKMRSYAEKKIDNRALCEQYDKAIRQIIGG